MPTTEDAKQKTEEEKPKKAPRKVAAKKPVKKESSVDAPVAEAEIVAASERAKGGSFIAALGRRKTSIAQVRLIKNGKGIVTINGREMEKYFSTYDVRDDVMSPLRAVGQETSVDVSAKVVGGGIRGQAQAVRLGIARALIELNPTFRVALKKLGYLSRDSRKRERKKFGKKSARRSPQWSKR
ncbi:MAG: 30S ribosomal protein S9 [Patescibacteria group bacterium]